MKRPETTVLGVAVAAAISAAITVAMGGTVTVAEPTPLATPGGSPVLVQDPSTDDGNTPKATTAHCPAGTHVYAAGAAIAGGDGGVVLTAMVPDPTLGSVTVRAAERTGHTGDWSVTAYAVCDHSTSPQLERATVASSSAATATCPSGSRVVGLGFHHDGPVDENYVDQVVMGPELREVRVHAGGPGTPTGLTAIAICKAFVVELGVRVEAPSLGDTAWPRTASVAVATSEHWFYGVGAVASPGAHLTALVPQADPSRATARAELASELPATAAGGSGDGSEQEGSTTVYGILIGTFH